MRWRYAIVGALVLGGCPEELGPPCIAQVLYSDGDLDGFGDGIETREGCPGLPGWVTSSGDCDDLDGRIHPGAVEICDGIDNNCDGNIDEGLGNQWFFDRDDDGFGDPFSEVNSCFPPISTVSTAGDCDDLEPLTFPGADEICDGRDNNCNTLIDEDPVDPTTFYVDADFDGFGTDQIALMACDPDPGTATITGDCDDADPTVYPGAKDPPDGIDNDCDGTIDG